MQTKEDVRKLAALARIEIPERDLEKFTKEFDAILHYVGQLEQLEVGSSRGVQVAPLHNVFRRDGEPHEKGKYTEKLVEQFPQKEGNALSVKQIIVHE